jgi:hypothetical protein
MGMKTPDEIELVHLARFAKAAYELGYTGHARDAEEVLERALPLRPHVEHTHHTGPLCASWHGSCGEGPSDCEHGSCAELTQENCESCVLEALIDVDAYGYYERQRERWFSRGRCPWGTNAPLRLRSSYAAPGTGRAWECAEGHRWAQVGSRFYRPEDGAHLLTPDDVR